MLEETEAEETDSDYSSGVDIDKVIKRTCYCQAQVQVPGQVHKVPGQVHKVQGLRAKDLDLG